MATFASLSSRWISTLSGAQALVVSWEITDAVKASGTVCLAVLSADELARDLRGAGWLVRSEGLSSDFQRVSVVAEMPPTEQDAKAACELGKLTGKSLRLPDGAVVTVERSNGYVMSGWDCQRGWWAIDLRNEQATVLA